jgi:hypothetical protein
MKMKKIKQIILITLLFGCTVFSNKGTSNRCCSDFPVLDWNQYSEKSKIGLNDLALDLFQGTWYTDIRVLTYANHHNLCQRMPKRFYYWFDERKIRTHVQKEFEIASINQNRIVTLGKSEKDTIIINYFSGDSLILSERGSNKVSDADYSRVPKDSLYNFTTYFLKRKSRQIENPRQ